MPATAVTAIETDAVSRLEPTGRVAQIGARCLGQQVKVIRHQAIRMDYKPETLDGFFKRLQKPLPIITINWLTFVAAGRDMIHGAFKLYSDRACHNARYDAATRCQVPQSVVSEAFGLFVLKVACCRSVAKAPSTIA